MKHKKKQKIVPTTLTLKNEYGTYSITIPKIDLTVSETIEELFNPVMLAAGYQQGSLDDYFGNEDWPSPSNDIFWSESDL